MANAFLFPGQGSQFIGMGKKLAESIPIAREVFEEVDEALNESLSSIIWSGELDELTLTKNAQPAIMAVSIAVFRSLISRGLNLDKISVLAGHSLGEYSAFCASGVFSLSDTANILRKRGLAMQKAVPLGKGAMAAILGLTSSKVSDLLKQGRFDLKKVQIANDNDPSQVVISGEKGSVEQFSKFLKDNGARKIIALPVSAPFHSHLMLQAAIEMESTLEEIEFSNPKIPIVLNVNLETLETKDRAQQSLINQITGTVRWRESLIVMNENKGVDNFYEIGPGKVLVGTVKRTLKDVRTFSACELEDIDRMIEVINV